ncbi:TPA: DUF905 domain-containing protein [Escherichia coli]|nr:DUF905 domain-containing protein [Escherichia coli]
MNPSDAIEAIEKPLSSLPYSLSRHILEHLRKLTSHEPVIGIMGKSGAGKSSLCNALFQGEVTPVSDVHAGTREVQRFRLSGHGHSMVITDLPGVGESRDPGMHFRRVIRNAEGQRRWRCRNSEPDAGKVLNTRLASDGLLRQ